MTELDNLVTELLRKYLSSEEVKLALEMYRTYKLSGSKGLKHLISNLIREIGVDISLE